MTLTFAAQTVPLKADNYGTIRVGGTRVRLQTVVYAFNQGYTAEEIMSKYPTLSLADVYSTIAYYLNHQKSVDAYIQEQEKKEGLLQEEIEAQPGYQNFRERLLSRHQERLSQ